MSNFVTVHCTGCGETFDAHKKLIGALCGAGRVRLATQAEEDAMYADEDPTAGFTYPMDR